MFLAESIDGQVIVVILMVLFAGAKALIEKLQNKGAPTETPDSDYEVEEEEEDYEEYARQLRQQREEILRRQQQASVQAPPPLPAAQQKEPSVYIPPKINRQTLSKDEQQALVNLQNGQSQKPRRKKSTQSSASARARKVLASPYAARDAVILSEILGPPKAMK